MSAFFDGGLGEDMLEFEGLYIGESLTNERLTDVLFMIDDINTVEIIDNSTGEVLTEIIPDDDAVLALNTVVINQTVEEWYYCLCLVYRQTASMLQGKGRECVSSSILFTKVGSNMDSD